MPSRLFLSSALALSFICLPTFARAQVETAPVAPAEAAQPSPPSTSPTTSSPRKTESYWYGWQLLTVDAVSLSVAGTGIGMNSSPIGYLGVAGVYLGAPITHLAHGRVGIAFASFGLRLGLPTIGGAIGYATRGPCPESERQGFFGCAFHGWSEAAAGGLIGLGTAMAIDAALLAHGERPVTPPRESGVPRVTSVAPSFDPLTRAAALGVGGTF